MSRRMPRCSAIVLLLALGLGATASNAFADSPPPPAPAPAPAPAAAASTPRTEPTSIAQLSFAKRPDVSYQASPSSWKNEVIGMVMVDRFNAGKATTPENLVRQPEDPKGWHGGNLAGITDKLDYLKGQGKTAIWISPVLGNGGKDGSYHGYAITDFLDTEKHFGTMKDLTTLVTEAHKRGMRVILDIVANHTGRAFEYKEPDTFGPGQKTIAKWNTQLYPTELQSPENFSRRGTVTQRWDDDETVNGDFIDGLRDFNLHDRKVQDRFIGIYKYIIARTGVDGFRVDTVKHVPAEFWPRFNREVKQYAASLGMHNFGTFAEHFAASPEEMARITSPSEHDFHKIDPNSTKTLGFTGALDFPSYNGELGALRDHAPTRQIEDARSGLTRTLNADQMARQGSFIDNHDVQRFLREDQGKPSELKVALARLYFRSGIPIVQYGTEQGMREIGHASDNSGVTGRGDMFAGGKFKWKGAAEGAQGSFNTHAPLYRMERLFKDVRDAYEPLREGAEYPRWSDPHGAGIYAFSRIQNGKEVIVVLNTADEPRSANNVWVDAGVWKNHVWQGNGQPGAAKLIDALHPSYTTNVGAVAPGNQYQGAQIGNVVVPPHGVRVLVSEHEYTPTPLRNFDPEGHEIPWHQATVAAAQKMSAAPSMDQAHVAPTQAAPAQPRFATALAQRPGAAGAAANLPRPTFVRVTAPQAPSQQPSAPVMARPQTQTFATPTSH